MENSVELLGYYGGDLQHAMSAWCSTSRELTEEKLNRIDKLLLMLATSGHETPFEKSSLHFLINTDIATHIHILKHRIGTSANAQSGRYQELKEDKYLIPSDWDKNEQNMLEEHCKESLEKYHTCYRRLLAQGIDRKRAKESARFYLPYANQITADIMFNFRSFVHFLRLRNSEHAQKEVREVAQKMLQLVKEIENNPFQHTIKAFNL